MMPMQPPMGGGMPMGPMGMPSPSPIGQQQQPQDDQQRKMQIITLLQMLGLLPMPGEEEEQGPSPMGSMMGGQPPMM